MVHSDATWIDVLEVLIASKNLKPMNLNGAFWRFLQLLAHFESKEASWCTRTLFETVVWKF